MRVTGKTRYGRLCGFCGVGAQSLPVVGQGLASFLRLAFNLSGSGIVLGAWWRAIAAHQVHTGLVRYKSIGHDLVEMFNRHGIHGYSYWRWGSAPRCSGLGRRRLLRLDGWQVEYTRYTEQNGYALPERLKLYGQDLEVTLVIKDWQPRKLGQ